MNNKVTTVSVLYQNIDGYHFFTSDEVKGLHIGSSDLHKAFHDVAFGIQLLMEANHGVKCTAEPIMTFDEFVEAATDGLHTREDADERHFALKLAA